MSSSQPLHLIVTGGASGLGAAVVSRFVSNGWRASIFDLDAEGGARMEAELGKEKVNAMSVNICDAEAVEKAIDAAIAKFGPLRAVIQCAGVANPCKVLSKSGAVHPLKGFEKVVAINLIGTFNVLRLAAARMAKQEPLPNKDGERGCFVHVASVAAFEGQIGQAAYSASKGGVVSMTLPLARELGSHGIRVNCIAPGIFGTPMLAKLPEKAKASLSAQVPFPKRLGAPDEFADCCMSLVNNQYYNGTVVRIDGSIRMSAM